MTRKLLCVFSVIILGLQGCAGTAFGDATVPAQSAHIAFVSALHGLFATARTASDIAGQL